MQARGQGGGGPGSPWLRLLTQDLGYCGTPLRTPRRAHGLRLLAGEECGKNTTLGTTTT